MSRRKDYVEIPRRDWRAEIKEWEDDFQYLLTGKRPAPVVEEWHFDGEGNACRAWTYGEVSDMYRFAPRTGFSPTSAKQWSRCIECELEEMRNAVDRAKERSRNGEEVSVF